MTAPSPAQTPGEVALRAKLLDGIDDCLLSDGPADLAEEIEKLWQHIAAALRAAAQAERERIAAELRAEAEKADSLHAWGALVNAAWRLSPAPEGVR